jgi:hypothetical protein
MSGSKNRSAARQAVKTARRIKRKGRRRWMQGDDLAEASKLLTYSGNGGTDKSGSKKKSIVYYSDKPARK